MSEQPASISVDDLHALLQAATQQVAHWEDAVRAEHGEIIAVIAYGEPVADVVLSGELDRMHETIEVLSDPRPCETWRTMNPWSTESAPSVPWLPNALPRDTVTDQKPYTIDLIRAARGPRSVTECNVE